MKKSILAVVILLFIITSLPIIGNTFIKNTIDERVVELKSFGLQTTKDETHATYLNTSRHFEFIIKDSKNFLNHLKQYSDKQIPSYVNAMIEGVVIGADVKYSNLPFAKAFEIEIYPINLSPQMNKKLKDDDMNFYAYVENLLNDKALMYHIEYNLLNDDFKGYIRDIQTNYTQLNGTKFILTLEKANFKGQGELLAPKELNSKIKKLHFEVSQDTQVLNIFLNEFKSSSNFESVNTYLTSVDIETIVMTLQGSNDDINIRMKKLRANASSNEQGITTQLNSKTSIKSLELHSNQVDLNIEKLNFDIALSELDKKEYLAFTQLTSQNNKSSLEVQESLLKLLSKGVVLEIADFSIAKFSKNSEKTIKGFELKSNLTLKEDKDLAKKMKRSPFMIIPDISFLSELKISKELYVELQKTSGMLSRFKGYEKEDGDDYIFVLEFIDGKASVNGRSLN